jgi:hypothetical protein
MMTQHKNILGLIFFIFNSREGKLYTGTKKRVWVREGGGGLGVRLFARYFFSSRLFLFLLFQSIYFTIYKMNKIN